MSEEEKEKLHRYVDIVYPDEEEQATTGFIPEVVEEILENARLGLKLEDCAYLVGLKPDVVNRWYSTDYGNFAEAINEQRAVNKKLHVSRVQAAKNNLRVKASSWYLERKYKEEFSKEVTVVVNHVLLDNVSNVLKGLLIKYIKDPEMLRLAAEEFQAKIGKVDTGDMPAKITT